MATYTSNLPDDLLQMLQEKAHELDLPKNKLMENALRIYLDQLKKAEYKLSYKRMQKDIDILVMAEEGMLEYFNHLDKDETR